MAVSNPYLTSSPANSFLLQTQGYVQGTVFDDPSARLWLMTGVYSASATAPLWGGLPIAENTLFAGSNGDGLGPTCAVATTNAEITGFSVYNQMNHMFIGVGSDAPIAAPSNSMGFFRLNTQQRVAVKCSPGLVTQVQGSNGEINQQISWNFSNNELDVYSSGTGALAAKLLSINTNSLVVNYDSGTGAVTWTTGPAAIILI